LPPSAEPRWNAPFVGIRSFLRSVIATDLDRLDGRRVVGCPRHVGRQHPGVARVPTIVCAAR